MSENRARQIQTVLFCRYASKTSGRLVIWPWWLHYEHLEALEALGLAYHKFYREAMGHTDYYINPPEGEALQGANTPGDSWPRQSVAPQKGVH